MIDETVDGVSAELPRWKCHKVVHAVKCKAWRYDGVGDPNRPTIALVTPCRYYAEFEVDIKLFDRSKPKDGEGFYYVVYEDGYASWSPVKAFEDGYTRIEN